MKKRIFTLFLALVMVIVLLPVTTRAEELDNGLQYKVYNTYVRITGYEGSATELVIPNEILGLPVTQIGSYAFYECTSLTNIKLPDSLTSINYGAFSCCTNLISISIPESVTHISDGDGIYDDSAFSYCTNLTAFHVDENNLYYSSDDRGVLFNKEKTKLIQVPGAITGSYVVPGGVTSIADRAFYDCSELTRVNLPASLTSVGYQTFISCNSLTGIHVDENNLNYSSDARGVLFNKNKTKLIQAPNAIAGSYIIPDGVTSIRDWAFADCESLSNISIPDSVVSIDYGAFVLCTNLTNITIPSSVTSIGDFAFDGCESLSTIIFKGDAPEFGDGSLYSVTATAYYPAGNDTWTEENMPYYGTTINWVPYTPTPFSDVPIGSFFADPVAWALTNGITTGASADSFNPNGQCLRAQVVTFLHRAAGNPAPASTTNPFTDVKTSDFFYAPVLWAVEKGITNGTGAATFGSYDVCNRAAVVTFLWRAAGSPEPKTTDNPFTDVRSSDFFYKPVLWAIENGITNGVDATHFGPTSPCNRAQVVTFLYRAYN